MTLKIKKLFFPVLAMGCLIFTSCSTSSSLVKKFTQNETHRPLAIFILENEEGNQYTIGFRLYATGIEKSLSNFKYLAENNFYDGMRFHRADKDFVSSGNPEYQEKKQNKAEDTETLISPMQKHKNYGTLGLAKAPENMTSGSEFYITRGKSDKAYLDGKNTILGEIFKEDDQILSKITTKTIIKDVMIVE